MSAAVSSSRKRRSDTAVVTANHKDSTANTQSAAPHNATNGGGSTTKLKVRIQRYHGVSQWVWGTYSTPSIISVIVLDEWRIYIYIYHSITLPPCRLFSI